MVRKNAGTPAATRLMKYVSPEPNSGCWLWTGTVNNLGYGLIYDGQQKRMLLAHRVSFAFHRREIPPGKVLDHLCRVTFCVNPDHLEPVTQKENLRRGDWRSSAVHWFKTKTACKRGHEFTEENIYWWRNERQCRSCRRLSHGRR